MSFTELVAAGCGIVLVGQALPGEDALTRLAHVGVTLLLRLHGHAR